MQWKVGKVKVTKVTESEGLSETLGDAIQGLTADSLLGMPWLHPHFITDDGTPRLSIHMLVVESEGKVIIVDTCVGNHKTCPGWEIFEGLDTPFLETFEEAGFDREQVDIVLCTHLHVDHVGWNTMLVDDKWVPTFPNAQYLWGRVEYEHWTQPHPEELGVMGPTVADTLRESIQPIVDAGLHKLVEMDHKLTSEVFLEPSTGHTPGHVCVRIQSEGEEAVITGDMMYHPSQVAYPEWPVIIDSDPVKGCETRREFCERYSNDETLVIGTHFITPTAGRIRPDGDRWRFEA